MSKFFLRAEPRYRKIDEVPLPLGVAPIFTSSSKLLNQMQMFMSYEIKMS